MQSPLEAEMKLSSAAEGRPVFFPEASSCRFLDRLTFMSYSNDGLCFLAFELFQSVPLQRCFVGSFQIKRIYLTHHFHHFWVL